MDAKNPSERSFDARESAAVLYSPRTIHQEKEPLLPELTVTFFDPLLPRKDSISKLNPGEEYDHLLDLFRSTFLSTVRARVKTHGWFSQSLDMPLAQDKQLIHCAVELREAGLQIRKRDDPDLLDIRFSDGVVQIPPLHVDDNTVPLLFNFLAFEQCDEEAKPFFTNFFTFLDSLIYSKVDVQILHKYGIINHVFGSEKDVANLINKLGREIVNDQDQCYLSLEMKGVNDHCKAFYESKLSLWWRNLIRIYFSNPWTVLSLLAAISLLLLTLVQTFYTMESYYHPHH